MGRMGRRARLWLARPALRPHHRQLSPRREIHFEAQRARARIAMSAGRPCASAPACARGSRSATSVARPAAPVRSPCRPHHGHGRERSRSEISVLGRRLGACAPSAAQGQRSLTQMLDAAQPASTPARRKRPRRPTASNRCGTAKARRPRTPCATLLSRSSRRDWRGGRAGSVASGKNWRAERSVSLPRLFFGGRGPRCIPAGAPCWGGGRPSTSPVHRAPDRLCSSASSRRYR